MVSRKILNSHSKDTLRKEISKTNITKYSKLKKSEMIDLMMRNSSRFGHIVMKAIEVEKPRKETPGSIEARRIREKISKRSNKRNEIKS